MSKSAKTQKENTKKAPKAAPAAKAEPMSEACATSAKADAGACASTDPAKTPQHGSICHIEFHVPNLEDAQKFYSSLFGWNFMPYKPTEMYFMTPGNWGPCGCMLQGKPSADAHTRIYVNVNDITSTLAKAGELGATTVQGKTEIPGGHGSHAAIKAPDGNTFSFYSKH